MTGTTAVAFIVVRKANGTRPFSYPNSLIANYNDFVNNTDVVYFFDFLTDIIPIFEIPVPETGTYDIGIGFINDNKNNFRMLGVDFNATFTVI
jgi:hypothetical protein